MVATCIYFNIESFCFLALPLLLGDILIELSKTDVFIFANGGLFIIILLASLYILEKKRHKMLFKQYEKESPKQREMRGWIVMVYVFLSVATLGVSIFIGREYILGNR